MNADELIENVNKLARRVLALEVALKRESEEAVALKRPTPSLHVSDRGAFLRMLVGDEDSSQPRLPLAKKNADAFFDRMTAYGFYRRAIEYDLRKLDPHWGIDDVSVDSNEAPYWYLNGDARIAVLAVYAPDSEWRITSAQNTPRQPLASGSGSTVLLHYAYLHHEAHWRVDGAESLVVAVARRA